MSEAMNSSMRALGASTALPSITSLRGAKAASSNSVVESATGAEAQADSSNTRNRQGTWLPKPRITHCHASGRTRRLDPSGELRAGLFRGADVEAGRAGQGQEGEATPLARMLGFGLLHFRQRGRAQAQAFFHAAVDAGLRGEHGLRLPAQAAAA